MKTRLDPSAWPEDTPTTEHPLLEPLRAIVRTQLEVNNAMAGPDWITEAVKAKRIDYSWAALDEAAELWRCAIPFKFWDRSEFVMDADNAKMEVVDLLHFAIAQDLATINDIHQPTYPETLVQNVAVRMFFAAEKVEAAKASSENAWNAQDSLRSSLKKFIHGLTRPEGTVIDWDALFGLARAVGLTPETLVSLYLAKATLNRFRTDMRSTHGSYSKVWENGHEDNHNLMMWASSLPVAPSPEDCRKWLEDNYTRGA